MSPKECAGGAGQQGSSSVVVDGQDTTSTSNWKQGRQRSRSHCTKCSPCVVTCRSGCVGLNPREPASQPTSRGLCGVENFRLCFGTRVTYQPPNVEVIPSSQTLAGCLVGNQSRMSASSLCWGYDLCTGPGGWQLWNGTETCAGLHRQLEPRYAYTGSWLLSPGQVRTRWSPTKLSLHLLDGKELYQNFGVGSLNGAKSLCDKLVSSSVPVVLCGLKTSRLMFLVNSLKALHRISIVGRC